MVNTFSIDNNKFKRIRRNRQTLLFTVGESVRCTPDGWLGLIMSPGARAPADTVNNVRLRLRHRKIVTFLCEFLTSQTQNPRCYARAARLCAVNPNRWPLCPRPRIRLLRAQTRHNIRTYRQSVMAAETVNRRSGNRAFARSTMTGLMERVCFSRDPELQDGAQDSGVTFEFQRRFRGDQPGF